MIAVFKMGDPIRNRRGREGVVEGDSGERDVLIRYIDGKKVVWVQRQNIERIDR